MRTTKRAPTSTLTLSLPGRRGARTCFASSTNISSQSCKTQKGGFFFLYCTRPYTHTHTHTLREKEREGVRESVLKSSCRNQMTNTLEKPKGNEIALPPHRQRLNKASWKIVSHSLRMRDHLTTTTLYRVAHYRPSRQPFDFLSHFFLFFSPLSPSMLLKLLSCARDALQRSQLSLDPTESMASFTSGQLM